MGIMTRETAAALISNTLPQLTPGDHITFAFQGGEPGLAGLDFFMFFIDKVKKSTPPRVKVDYAMQTNGLMIDDNWCNFFKKNKFLIGLSLDGDLALHNQNRMDSIGKGTFSRVMKAKKMLDQHNVMYNILCVLTQESARRAKRIWDFILQEKISHIQFIPCMEPLGENPKEGPALTSDRFYRFYSTLFPLWKKEAERGNIVSIRLFEDLASLFLAGQPVTCGISGSCTPQIIVEADGGVYPCDFYVLDEHQVSDLTTHSLEEVFNAVVKSSFLKEQRRPLPGCEKCQHNRWCKGGCKRMARAVYGEGCGMRLFLDERLGELLAVYRLILRQSQ